MREERERKYSDSFYDTARRSFSNTLWVPLIMLGADMIISIGFVFYAELTDVSLLDDPIITTVLSTVPMYAVGLPLGYLLLRKMPKVNRAEHSLRLGQFMKYYLVSMAAVYVGNLAGMLLQGIVAAFTGVFPVYEVGEMVSSIPYWLVLVLTVIAAPIVEELVFRKLLIDRVQQYGSRLAIVFSGISFGLFHGNITQCFYAALLGMIFAYVYIRTGKIIYPILLHMMVNFYNGMVGLWVTDLAGPQPEEFASLEEFFSTPGIWLEFAYSAVTLILVIIGVAIFSRNRKNLRFPKAGMELEKEDCFSVAFFNAGAVALFVYFAISTVSTYLV